MLPSDLPPVAEPAEVPPGPDPNEAARARKNLGRKARRASKAQMIGTALSKGLSLGLHIVLARLLAPRDYGLLTVSVLVTGFVTIFTNFGFQTYLIQSEEETPAVVSSTFYLQVGAAALLCLGLFAGAGLVARLNTQGAAFATMLRLYSVAIFIGVVGQAPLALLKRHMDFHLSVTSEMAFTIASSISKVGFALLGFGALCFPLGEIIGQSLKAALVFYHTRLVPRLRDVSLQQIRQALHFGGLTAVTSLASYAANQADKFLITLRFPVAQIGLYTFGYTQSSMAYNLLLSSQSGVFLSLFARLRNDPEGARAAYFRVSRMLNVVLVPFHVFLILFADVAVTAVFGPKWAGSVIFFRLFAIDFLSRSMMAGITGIQISFGLAAEAARTKVINSVILISFLLVATLFRSLTTYAVFYLLGSTVAALINLHVNSRLIGVRPREVYGQYGPVFLCTAVAATVGVVCARLLPAWPVIALLAVLVSVYLGSYGLASVFFNPQGIRDARGLLRRAA